MAQMSWTLLDIAWSPYLSFKPLLKPELVLEQLKERLELALLVGGSPITGEL